MRPDWYKWYEFRGWSVEKFVEITRVGGRGEKQQPIFLSMPLAKIKGDYTSSYPHRTEFRNANNVAYLQISLDLLAVW